MIYNPNFNCTEFDAIEIRIEVSCRRTSSRKRAELWHKKKLDEHFYKHVVKPKRDPVGIRTQDPQLRRLLLYPAELRNHHICECKDSESIRENANMRKK